MPPRQRREEKLVCRQDGWGFMGLLACLPNTGTTLALSSSPLSWVVRMVFWSLGNHIIGGGWEEWDEE